MLLQFGIPGAVELIVIVLIAIVVFGVPLVLIAVVGALWLRGGDEYDERIRELETEIARLQAQVGDDGSSAGAADAGSASSTDGGSADATEAGSAGTADAMTDAEGGGTDAESSGIDAGTSDDDTGASQ